MSDKVYIKLPRSMRPMLIAQIVIGIIFLPFGIVFFVISSGDAKIFVAIFALIWMAVCAGMIMMSVKALRFLEKGKIQIGEIEKEERGDHE